MIDGEISLTDYLVDNLQFHELVSKYEVKIHNTKAFLDKKEFIQDELKRFNDTFLKPLEVSIGGDFRISAGINFTEYTKQAYDLLKSGHDYKIKKLIDGAIQRAGVGFDRPEIRNGVDFHLQQGAAYILYEQYLKESLLEANEGKKTARKIRKFLTNPWTIAILATVAAAILTKLLKLT